jgi:hypothetical protein
MANVMTAEDLFEKVRAAALAATGPDERGLQIDYPALKEQILTALGGRQITHIHVNRFLPEGYEDQGRFNVLLLTVGKVLYDLVIGDSYFRYDLVSISDLDKIQVIDAVWENREKRQEEPFLSLRLMHSAETHLLLAFNDGERKSLLDLLHAVAGTRHPER